MVFHSTRHALIVLGIGGVFMAAFLGLFWLALMVPAFATWVVVAELAALLLITALARLRRRRSSSAPTPTHTPATWI